MEIESAMKIIDISASRTAIKKVADHLKFQNFTPRKYKIPKGYLQWGDLLPQLKVFAAGKVSVYLADGDTDPDFASAMRRVFAATAQFWLTKSGPLFVLDRRLFEAFEKTDIPDFIPDFKIPAPSLIILLPERVIRGKLSHHEDRMSPGYIDWVLVTIEDASEVTDFDFGQDVKFAIHMTGADTAASAFSFEVLIGKNGEILRDRSNMSALTETVLHSLMTLTSMPELISEDLPPTISTTGKGFAKTLSKKDSIIHYPRWIGKDFNIKRDSPTAKPSASISNREWHIDAFWRRGHWRRIAHGKGRQLRRWEWIKPTLIRTS